MVGLRFPPGGEMCDPSPFVETGLGGMVLLDVLSVDLLVLATTIPRGGEPFSGPTTDDGVVSVSLSFAALPFHEISQCRLQVLPALTVRPK